MKKMLLVTLLFYPLSAFALTYQWTDEHGTVSFTEDLGNVPKKFRKKVRRVEGEENGTPQTTLLPEPVKSKDKAEEPAKGKKLYGGKDEAAWRSEFVAATADIKRTELELAELQGRLNDISKMSRPEYLMIQSTIKNDESRLSQQRKKLELLRESADRLGVPAEYRQ